MDDTVYSEINDAHVLRLPQDTETERPSFLGAANMNALIITGITLEESDKKRIEGSELKRLQLLEELDRTTRHSEEHISEMLLKYNLKQLPEAGADREQIAAKVLAYYEAMMQQMYAEKKYTVVQDPKTLMCHAFVTEGKYQVELGLPLTRTYNYLLQRSLDPTILDTGALYVLHEDLDQDMQNVLFNDSKKLGIEHEAEKEIMGPVAERIITTFSAICSETLDSSDASALKANLSKLADFCRSFAANKVWEEKNYYSTEIGKTYSLRGELASEFKQFSKKRAHMQPELNTIVLKFFEEEEDTLMRAFGNRLLTESKVTDCEDFMVDLLSLTANEVKEKRTENWQKVKTYIETLKSEHVPELTINHIIKILSLSSKGIIPKQFCRLRSAPHYDEVFVHKGLGLPAEFVEKELSLLLLRANEVIKSKNPKAAFLKQAGSLFADYVRIHPHPDANGTMAVFFCEIIAVLSGFNAQENYAGNYKLRVIQTLRYNPYAIFSANRTIEQFQEGKNLYKEKEYTQNYTPLIQKLARDLT